MDAAVRRFRHNRHGRLAVDATPLHRRSLKPGINSLATQAIVLVLAGLCSPGAHSQHYPSRPVHIVVPFPAGGGTDTTARVLAEKLQTAFGQPFIIDNKPGATGNIGTDLVAKSAPDGYTLLVVPNSLATNQLIFSKLPFDALKDLAPIVLIGSSPVMIGARSALPASTVAELVAVARQQAGKLTFASCGTGSPQHIAGELLDAMAQIQMVHVSYKGCAQAIPDLIGGQVDLAFSTIANLSPHIKAGKVKGIAVTTARRSAFAPDLPTVQESGFPGYIVDIWFGMLGPAGLPKEIISRLNSQTNQALTSSDVREKMASQFYESLGGTPEQLVEVIRQDITRFGKVVRDAKIRPE